MSADGTIANLVRGGDLTANLQIDADVAIVGSGPGGSIAAYRLAAAGARVVVLEEGGYHTRPDFRMQEEWSYPNLYQDHGNRATDDLSITVLQGRSVGGGTTVNWTTSLRTPVTTLDFWKRKRRVEGLTLETLTPHWDEIEKRLSVHTMEPDEINENNRALMEGARRLGYGFELLPRNVSNCMLSGMRPGMPGRRQAGDAPDVSPRRGGEGRAGIRRLPRDATRPERPPRDGGAGRRPRPVHQDRPAERTVTVRAKTFVLAAGAINTPRLLQRSAMPDHYKIVDGAPGSTRRSRPRVISIGKSSPTSARRRRSARITSRSAREGWAISSRRRPGNRCSRASRTRASDRITAGR
jgi:choline dehydrogenase-like flavoprotein